MTDKTNDIYQVNDSFFHKIFDSPANARDFLDKVLPEELKRQLDLSDIEIKNTKYASNQFKKGYSDIVVKTSLITKTGKKRPVDIYFIIEHKTEGRVEIFIQLLKYMVFEWEKDYNANQPPRAIIPVVFYHGLEKWTVPRSFADQFDVDEELKQFLLDYRYILFDTNAWDFRDESNKQLKENVFLFTAMVLLKAAYKNDMSAVMEIFNFWYERGFIDNKDVILFFLTYISYTHEIGEDKIKKMLDESNLNGGELMYTLAQQMKDEGRKEGKKEGIRETARRMLLNNFSIEQVVAVTGLSEKEIKGLMS